MSIATVGAFALGEYAEAVAVMLFIKSENISKIVRLGTVKSQSQL